MHPTDLHPGRVLGELSGFDEDPAALNKRIIRAIDLYWILVVL